MKKRILRFLSVTIVLFILSLSVVYAADPLASGFLKALEIIKDVFLGIFRMFGSLILTLQGKAGAGLSADVAALVGFVQFIFGSIVAIIVYASMHRVAGHLGAYYIRIITALFAILAMALTPVQLLMGMFGLYLNIFVTVLLIGALTLSFMIGNFMANATTRGGLYWPVAILFIILLLAAVGAGIYGMKDIVIKDPNLGINALKLLGGQVI